MPTSLLLILTAAGFGASPLLIAEAVAYFPPWTLAALRSALGLPLLILAAGALGPQKRLSRYDLLTALVGGTLVVAIPFVSMAAGMQYIPSGMGGMLYATMPLFTLAMAAMFLHDEPATLEQGMRIGVGILGVLLISVPAIMAGGFGQAGLGTLLTLISPLSYAAGNVWFRRRRRVAPLMLSAAMFAVGTVAIWPLALLIDGPVAANPSFAVIGTLLALVVLATVAPNLLNYALVQQAGANRAALAMFLMPAFSVVFGMIFRDERLPLLAFGGLALVIAASTVKLPKWRRAKSALAAEAQGHRVVRQMGPAARARAEAAAEASATPTPAMAVSDQGPKAAGPNAQGQNVQGRTGQGAGGQGPNQQGQKPQGQKWQGQKWQGQQPKAATPQGQNAQAVKGQAWKGQAGKAQAGNNQAGKAAGPNAQGPGAQAAPTQGPNAQTKPAQAGNRPAAAGQWAKPQGAKAGGAQARQGAKANALQAPAKPPVSASAKGEAQQPPKAPAKAPAGGKAGGTGWAGNGKKAAAKPGPNQGANKAAAQKPGQPAAKPGAKAGDASAPDGSGSKPDTPRQPPRGPRPTEDA